MYMVRRYKVLKVNHWKALRLIRSSLYHTQLHLLTQSTCHKGTHPHCHSFTGFNLRVFPIYLFVDSGNCFFWMLCINLQTLTLCLMLCLSTMFSVKLLDRNISKKVSICLMVPNLKHKKWLSMVHQKSSFHFLHVIANTSLGERITLNYFKMFLFRWNICW